jgi:hypothetical protein
MPITIRERPEVFTEASLLDSEPPLLIGSNAVGLLTHELRRYCRREVSGRSFLIAGHRGAGKTTLVLNACQEVLKKFRKRDDDRFLRPLLVMLQGPNLLPNDEDELPVAEDAGKKDTAQQDSAKKDSAPKKIGAMENVLRQITLGLYRALAREISQAFRDHATGATASDPELANGIARGELIEFAAALELELDEYPGKSRLRQFWQTAGALETGVLWPRPPGTDNATKSTASPRERIGQVIAEILKIQPMTPIRPLDQGFRELVALCSACEAYRRISGTFTSRQEDKEGAKASEERKMEADLKGKEILGPLMPVLVGALAGTGVLAANASGPTAAFAGAFAAIASAFALKYASSRSRERSATREDLFIPDLGVATLDRVLPVLIDRLRAAGLAPIFVIDELDKVERLSTRIPEMVRRLKKLVSENAFFCFLTDRTYYEEMREREAKNPYSIEHTYFTHQLFIIFRHRDLHKFLHDILKAPETPPDLAQAPPLAAGSVSDQGGNVQLEKDDCEVLPYVLLYAARMHSIDLRRELVRIRGEKGIVTLTAGAVQGGGRYGLELQMQVAIETLLDEEDMERELDRHPAFRRLAHDALYYLAERWEDADHRLELHSPGARLKFKKYLCSRMTTDPPEKTDVSKPASAGKSASRTAKKRKTKPPDITDSDLDFLWTRVRDLAGLLSSNKMLLTRARLRGTQTDATGTRTVPLPTVKPQAAPPFPEVVLKAVSPDPLLAPLDGKEHCYRWCWYPAGRRIHIPTRRGAREPEKKAPSWKQQIEFIRAFEKELSNVTRSGVTFADLGANLNIISTSPPWKIVEEAMSRLKTLGSKGSYASLDDDAEKVAKFDDLLKRSADSIAYALCAAAALKLWGKSERASDRIRLSLATISSVLSLRRASEAKIAEWMKELFQQVRRSFTTDDPPALPPVTDKPGIEAWREWLRAEMAAAEWALRRTVKDFTDTRARAGRAWQHWHTRLVSSDSSVVNLDSLICARRGSGPSVYFKFPIEEMTVQEWSDAFHAALGIDLPAKGEEQPPPWLAFAALSRLGFADRVATLQKGGDVEIQRFFQNRRLAKLGREALVSWRMDSSSFIPLRSAFVLRRFKTGTVGTWKPDPMFPLLAFSHGQGEASIQRDEALLGNLRRGLNPDLVIFDLTELPVAHEEDTSALTRTRPLPPDGPVENAFWVPRQPLMSRGVPIVLPPDLEPPSTGFLCVINPKSSEDLFQQLEQQQEIPKDRPRRSSPSAA